MLHRLGPEAHKSQIKAARPQRYENSPYVLHLIFENIAPICYIVLQHFMNFIHDNRTKVD